MADADGIQGSLADSIAMLEQILEVMPQDAEALKALYNAYAQGGHPDRAFSYLCRLVDVVFGGGSPESLSYVQQELPKFEEGYASEVAAQIARLRMLGGGGSTQSEPEPEAGGGFASSGQDAGGAEIDISEELALAWKLYEENQLSQEEYSSVLHDLTEVSSKDVAVPVTVLHVLNDRGYKHMNKIMNYLSSRSGVPFVELNNYELDEELVSLLPLEFAVRDGAIPFSTLGEDLLVAVLNPFNHLLVDKVESKINKRCHTYLVGPDDYDAALAKMKKMVSGRE